MLCTTIVEVITMLREKTESAIAILHEANGTRNVSRIPSFASQSGIERHQLEELLISSGYLDYSGKLLRSLDSISLYEILSIVDEGVYPAHVRYDLIGDLPVRYHIPPRKMGLYQDMMRELLMRMKVSEL